MNNLKIDGNEYELIPIQDGVTLHHSTPFVSIGGKIYVGKAVLWDSYKDVCARTGNNPASEEKKEWEVLLFKNGGMEYEHRGSGLYKLKGQTSNAFPHIRPTGFETVEILSVKRLSGGEVFSIGDYLEGHPSPISQIKIGEYGSRQNFTPGGDNVWLSTSGPDYGNCLSVALKRKERKVFLTTQDGVEIYDDEKDRIVYGLLTKGGWDKSEGKVGAISPCSVKGTWIYFSRNHARSEYEAMNRPALSLAEVIKAFNLEPSDFQRNQLYTKIYKQFNGIQ